MPQQCTAILGAASCTTTRRLSSPNISTPYTHTSSLRHNWRLFRSTAFVFRRLCASRPFPHAPYVHHIRPVTHLEHRQAPVSNSRPLFGSLDWVSKCHPPNPDNFNACDLLQELTTQGVLIPIHATRSGLPHADCLTHHLCSAQPCPQVSYSHTLVHGVSPFCTTPRFTTQHAARPYKTLPMPVVTHPLPWVRLRLSVLPTTTTHLSLPFKSCFARLCFRRASPDAGSPRTHSGQLFLLFLRVPPVAQVSNSGFWLLVWLAATVRPLSVVGGTQVKPSSRARPMCWLSACNLASLDHSQQPTRTPVV